MSTPQRRDALDVMRAAAAMAVVVHHVGFSSGYTLNGRLGDLTGRLDVGVAIFFVLSGHLLFGPWAIAIFGGADPPRFGTFLLRRAMRIFPAYWCALAGLLLLDAVQVGDIGGLFATATLTQVYQQDTALLGIVQAWSLSTEIAFYLALPLIGHLLLRLAGRRSINQRALVTLAALTVVGLGAYVFRSGMTAWGGSWNSVSNFWLPAHLDTFAAGMAVATVQQWAASDARVRDGVRRLMTRRWPWILGAVVIFVVMATQFELSVGLQSASLNRELARHACYTAIGLLLVAPFALGDATHRRTVLLRAGAWVGLVSYGVYLWHQVLIAGTFSERAMPWDLFDGSFWPRLAATVPLAVALGAASWWLVERPALAVSERFRRR